MANTSHLTTTPSNGPCEFSAADLDGKKLRWRLQSPLDVSEAPASLMLADEMGDGNVSVALKDSVESKHRDSDGNPVVIDVFGIWLTPESLGFLKRCDGEGEADFEAIAEH